MTKPVALALGLCLGLGAAPWAAQVIPPAGAAPAAGAAPVSCLKTETAPVRPRSVSEAAAGAARAGRTAPRCRHPISGHGMAGPDCAALLSALLLGAMAQELSPWTSAAGGPALPAAPKLPPPAAGR
ncbi:MAG: hypothetical protein Tsb0032_25130 [Kiloniellaceae bacterium]